MPVNTPHPDFAAMKAVRALFPNISPYDNTFYRDEK